MPAQAGETLLTTVYADVHYFFKVAAPSQPQHDRFAKSSYVYLFYSTHDRRAKLEIANHAGTADQDAFYGYLDSAQCISYSTKHPTMCSVVLDQPSIRTQAEWHLPTWDDRNEKRWAHKIHSLDLYFWTEADAVQFMTKLNAIVPADRLDIGDLTQQRNPAEHKDSMSPVVQQLERTVISARAGSTTSAQSLPGPPTPSSVASVSAPYNPAAPAAPEPIAYREKTPPPSDGASGNGLASAARYDSAQQQQYPAMTQQYAQYGQQQQHSSSLQNTPQSSYFPGPPQDAASPPPVERQASFGLQSSSPAPAAYGHSHPYGVQTTSPEPITQQQPSFGPQATASFGPTAPATVQYASYPTSSQPHIVTSPGVTSSGIYSPMPPTPSAPPAYASLQSPGLPPPSATLPPTSTQTATHQPQVAVFSQYQYQATQQPSTIPVTYNPAGGFTGNMHAQVYRPTEEEAAHGHKSKPKNSTKSSFEDKHKISERVTKVEKGIGNFLKRLDNL